MRRTIAEPIIAISVAACLGAVATSSDPLTLCTPARFSTADIRARIGSGAAVMDVLPGSGRDVGVFGTVRTQIDGDRLVAWTRHIEEFQKGPYVPIVIRFSDPPRIEDLDTLQLGASDLEELRHCRVGDCGLKLAAQEIERLREVASVSGVAWRSAVQAAFRRLMLDRAASYLANGDDSTAPYADHQRPLVPAAEFEAVVGRMRDGSLRQPRLLEYLRRFPRNGQTDTESFLYWSKDVFGRGKPVISITHVAITRGSSPTGVDALVASKQIFATHYLSASLSLIGVTHPSASGDRYLLYTRHFRVDLFDGPFSGVARQLVERRIQSDAPSALDGMRRRLESGGPGLTTRLNR